MAGQSSCCDSSLIYTLTPQVPFTPNNATERKSYKIGSVLSATETRHVEYKIGGYAISNLAEHIQRYGSAFLNSGGGTLALGIADDGTVVGIIASRSTQDRIRRIVTDEFEAFKPSVTADLYKIDFVPCCTNDRYILEIHVRAGLEEEIYVDRHDKMFIRRDGSVQGPLWPRDIKEIVLEKFKKALNSSTGSDHRLPLVDLANSTPVIERISRSSIK